MSTAMKNQAMSDFAKTIRDKALVLGYENCGIIPVESVADYADKLNERIDRVPMGEQQFGDLRGFASPQERFPWVKSIVVLVHRYSVYNVPPEVDGVYAKTYLFDDRLDENADAFKRRRRFGEFMDEIGVRHVTESKFGLTALRWAAVKAGLGTIRRNNFFYTPNGSYLMLEAFLIDKEAEWIDDVPVKPCPTNCRRCEEACTSKSLCAPYTMVLASCMSFQTSLSANIPGAGIPTEEMATCIGKRLYGCDACQDACPFNKDKWIGGEDFSGLDALLPSMRPERIMEMSYEQIAETLGRKFWYIEPENLWKWKLNALTVMRNDYCDRYERAVRLGLSDPVEAVREFATRVCRKLAGEGITGLDC